MTLTKTEFAKYIKSLKDNWNFGNELMNLFDKYHGDIGICQSPDCSIALAKLLSRVMNDKNDWIGYFCYELDFGKNWAPGMITDINGKDISLATVDDLWDLLNN